MSVYSSQSKNFNMWKQRTIRIFLWLLLGFVFVFSIFNTLMYLLLPVDGAEIWVRQGPMEVLNTSLASSLQEGDVILKIQGQEIDWWLAQRWRTWPSIIQRIGQSSPTTDMTILRHSNPESIIVPLDTRLGQDVRLQFFTHMIVAYAFLIAGIIILRSRRKGIAEHIATLVMVLMALIEQNEILLILGAEWAWSTLWFFIPIRLLTRWFTYSSALHISLIFPHPKPWLKRVPYLPIIIHLLNPAVSLIIMLTTVGNLQTQHAAAYAPSKNIYIVYLFLACAFFVQSYRNAQDIAAKNQVRWIAWGAVMAVVPNLLLVDIPFLLFGYKFLPALIYSSLLLFIPASIVIAILRYHLWDIDLVIKASVLYGTLTILLGIVYIALVSLFVGLLGLFGRGAETENNFMVFFISALVIAMLFTPARDYLQQGIDRIFFGHRLDYAALMTSLSQALSTSLLLDDLLILLSYTIPEHLKLKGGQVILDVMPDQDSTQYQELQRGHLIWLSKIDDLDWTPPPPLDKLHEAGLWACLPLLAGDKFMGLYGVGPKKSGEYYAYADITLLETLARQAGMALQNAQLHEQLSNQVRIQRDLEIASQIQASLLPAQDPQIAGLEIVSYARPAHEVGGDFHHYIEFDHEQIGIAVGDVSGKGISGALFMAISISTLQAQILHHHDTAALLSTMNNILHPQMSLNRINTAMLYATIKKHNQGRITLEVSNAGLIWPILYRQGQEIAYVDISGLPIGSIANAHYQTLRLDLLAGDLLIILSDGVVEAKNNQQEMFGFERLEKSISSNNNQVTAVKVLEQLKKDISVFVNYADFHDDMTIIAIRVI